MAYEKILILEARWSDRVEDTRATREIYASAETLLSVHPEQPIRIIQTPLLSGTYLADIDRFVGLPSNQSGPNLVIFSAHGSHCLVKSKNGEKHRRFLQAFDGDINLSTEIRRLKGRLDRTILVLDACEAGDNIASFRRAAGALGAVGFSKSVSWVDSSVFVLAMLLRLQESNIFHLRRARKSSGSTQGRAEKVIEDMATRVYKSLVDSLGLQYSFAPASETKPLLAASSRRLRQREVL